MKKNTENNDIKHRSTFAVLFYINRTKVRKDGTCQLLCKVSIDAEWEQIGTKVSVNPAIWNPGKGRADGRSANAVTVNRAIDDLTAEIEGHYRRIKDSLGFITAELVKNAVKGIGQKPLTLLALFRDHNEEYRKRIGVDRIKETYDSYMRSYKHLSAFVHEKKGVEDVTLRSLDRAFYDDFEVFLRTDRDMSPKTVHEHLYRLKKMTMRAVSQGTLRRDPYCRLHPELPRRKSRHMKLEDLKKLMETPVEKPQLQFVRDMFIFSTFTGLEHEPEIEVMRFAGTWKDLGTWNTLTEAMDSQAVGEAMFNEKCENVHVVNELDVPILCMGLKDVVISASPEGILVSDKEQSSYIKPFVNTLDHRVMFAEKSWGSFKVIDIDKASMTIKVTLNAGHQMNYHSHQHRDEVWTVIAGEGKTVVDGIEQNVKVGDVITMAAGCRHTVIAKTKLKLIEVQLGEAIDVHDKQKFALED